MKVKVKERKNSPLPCNSDKEKRNSIEGRCCAFYPAGSARKMKGGGRLLLLQRRFVTILNCERRIFTIFDGRHWNWRYDWITPRIRLTFEATFAACHGAECAIRSRAAAIRTETLQTQTVAGWTARSRRARWRIPVDEEVWRWHRRGQRQLILFLRLKLDHPGKCNCILNCLELGTGLWWGRSWRG